MSVSAGLCVGKYLTLGESIVSGGCGLVGGVGGVGLVGVVEGAGLVGVVGGIGLVGVVGGVGGLAAVVVLAVGVGLTFVFELLYSIEQLSNNSPARTKISALVNTALPRTSNVAKLFADAYIPANIRCYSPLITPNNRRLSGLFPLIQRPSFLFGDATTIVGNAIPPL
ncbi:MAG: hypothetical protein OYH77_05755 [Pseudomonadota bacterium]|nr:hypothetical protein [Pseudomonadota bacterium]